MKFTIKHEIPGRLRVHMKQKTMTLHQADLLQYYLASFSQVQDAKVYERTADAVILYTGSRQGVLDALRRFHYQDPGIEELVPERTGRELNRTYQDKLVNQILLRGITKFLLPAPLRTLYTGIRALTYISKGIKSLKGMKLRVEFLDATAITVSILRRDFNTAGSVMFLLNVGEVLEEWTHHKSVDDLARSMALNIEKVWLKQGGTEVLVPIQKVAEGDLVCVRMGNMIPLDGTVYSGEAMVNQSSLTGESMPVKKGPGATVYAGTVLEEGELFVKVRHTAGATRYEKIVTMIEDSEKLKSSLESKASRLADALVPYSLGGTILTWLVTRNTQKALSILMVDFSCALKLAMPITVLSAMRESSTHQITVKGGKYLEAVAEADTILFDKTGTLTKAKPVVTDVIPFNGKRPDELLRIAACLEEHFPHSMATAVVLAAKQKGLSHEEMHSKVEYIVAHGISSYINGERVVIGSPHFVFDDEKCAVPPGMEERFDTLPSHCSHLYLAIGGKLAAVICIEDPLRPEAAGAVESLRKAGFQRIVMMTGDSSRTAKAIADQVGITEFYAEVMPEDKAAYVKKIKDNGHKVIMIGDGINDTPALSAADAGIAISEGAAIAREVADITISADDLYELVTLKKISARMTKRIQRNYHSVIGFNLGLIVLGVAGILAPATSALLHNTSTLLISLKSMTNLLEEP